MTTDGQNSPTRRLPRTQPLGGHRRAWWLALLIFLSLGAIGIFVDLAEDVETADPITVMDLAWAKWLHAHGTPALTDVMLAVSTLHGMLSLTIATILLAMFLTWRRQRDWLLGLLWALPGGMALNALLKSVFARARPHFIDPIVILTSYSFPSGHVAGSTLFYGFVAAWLISRTHSVARYISIVLSALLMVTLVALSRMYLGAHFFSDVLAAFFESLAWLGIGLVAIHVISGRRNTSPQDMQ